MEITEDTNGHSVLSLYCIFCALSVHGFFSSDLRCAGCASETDTGHDVSCNDSHNEHSEHGTWLFVNVLCKSKRRIGAKLTVQFARPLARLCFPCMHTRYSRACQPGKPHPRPPAPPRATPPHAAPPNTLPAPVPRTWKRNNNSGSHI